MNFIEKIIVLDKEFFLYLNSKNADWADPIMLLFSSFPFWIFSFLCIYGIVLYRSRLKDWGFGVFLLLGIGCNSLLNTIVKEIVERARPIHIEAWEDIIHAIEYYDNSYSFFSAHSSNSFTLAMFSALYFRNKWYSLAIALWASIVAYSRIYLAKHFPLDVVCGILFGCLMGYVSFKVYAYYKKRKL